MHPSWTRLSKPSLEAALRAMTVEHGRAAYLAYGSVHEAVTGLKILARGYGVPEDALAHAICQVRTGASLARRLPTPRALSR